MAQKVATTRKMKSQQETTFLGQIATVTAKKKNKGWDQEDKVVSSSNTIFSKERQKPPKTVILLQIVMVSPGTHLVKSQESQSRTNESQYK